MRRSSRKRQLSTKLREYVEVSVSQDGSFTETSDGLTNVNTSPETKPVSTKGKVGRPRKTPGHSENKVGAEVTAGRDDKGSAGTPKRPGSGKVGRPRKYAVSLEKKGDSTASEKPRYLQGDGKYSPTKVIVIKPPPRDVDKATNVTIDTTDHMVVSIPGIPSADTDQPQQTDDNNQLDQAEEDVNNETEPCLDSIHEASTITTKVSHEHISLLHNNAEWPLVKCRSDDCGCGLVHCPLCPPDKFQPRKMCKARKHFQATHIGHSTSYGDILICMCYLPCDKETPHHHCPRCGAIYCRRRYIEAHLKKCSGVRRAQPRKPPALVNRLANDLWLTLKEETGTGRLQRPLDFGAFTHLSFVHELKDLDVTRCTEGCSKFHCPLCPSDVFKPAFPQKVKDHLQHGHWKQRFMYRGVTILKCCLPCLPRSTTHGESHWHCPRCPLKCTSRGRLQYHLNCHDQGTTRSLRVEEEPPHSDTGEPVCSSENNQEMMHGPDNEQPEVETETENLETNKEIFQMVAAVLTTDLLDLIPGSKAVFFEALHAQTSVQYQLADKDRWCLLHANRWQQLKQASAVLENISLSPPETVEDLTAKLNEYSTETGDYPVQTQDEQHRQQEFATSLISEMHSNEYENSNFMSESIGDEEGLSSNNANDSSPDWTAEEPQPKRTKVDTSSSGIQRGQIGLQVKTEDVAAEYSHTDIGVEEGDDEQETTTQEGESVVIKQEPSGDKGHDVTVAVSQLSPEYLDPNTSNGVGDTSLSVKDDAETTVVQHDSIDDTGRSYPHRRCPLCNRLFETRSKLLTHLASANCILFWGENKQIPEDLSREMKAMEEVQGTACPRCGKNFQYKRNAKTHYALNLCGRAPVRRNPEKLVKDAVTKMYHCRHCDFTAHSPKKILEHEARSHLEKKYQCNVCQRKYGSEYLLNQHMKWTHFAAKTTVICHVCGRTMKSKYLKRHLQICHDPNYVQRERREPGSEVHCPKCSYVGRSMRGLRRHHARRHDEKTLQCGECSTRFALQVDLSRHVLVMHSEESPARATTECPHCQKVMLKKNLDVHIRNVHEKIKEHVCCICSKAFQTKYTLHCHLETHKKRSERTYKFLCAVCGGSFNNKTVYHDHVNMHTGNRPYQCKVCSKSFKQISTYSRHMNLHRSGGRFQCEVCGESFTRQRLLDAHMTSSRRHTDKVMCLCGLQLDNIVEANSHKATCSVWLGQAVDLQTTAEIENLLALAQEQSQVVADGTAAATVVTADGETLFLFQDDKLAEESQQGTLVVVNKPASDDTMVAVHADGCTVSATDEHNSDAMNVSSDVNLIVTEMDVTKQEGGEETDVNGDGEEQSFLCGYCQQLFVGLELVQNHMLTAHLNELPQDTDQIQLALHPSEEDDRQHVDGLLLAETDAQQVEAEQQLDSYPVDAQQLVLDQTATQEIELQQVDTQLLATDQAETEQLEAQEYTTE